MVRSNYGGGYSNTRRRNWPPKPATPPKPVFNAGEVYTVSIGYYKPDSMANPIPYGYIKLEGGGYQRVEFPSGTKFPEGKREVRVELTHEGYIPDRDAKGWKVRDPHNRTQYRMLNVWDCKVLPDEPPPPAAEPA